MDHEVWQKLQDLVSQDQRVQQVIDNCEIYPEDILKMLSRNLDMLNFVLEYAHIGIRIPSKPDKVCDEVYQKTGIVMMVVDANDLTVELLGKSEQLQNWPDSQLLALIVDNPAGQDRQLTPFILIREIS